MISSCSLGRDRARPRRPDEIVEVAELVMMETDRLVARGSVDVDRTTVAPARVWGDPDELARAVRNLLDNAERHASSLVSVSVEVRGPVARVVVGDDGPGIGEADRQRIFDRFTRLDEARARDTGGAGLGLAIVRDIVGRHGGSVRVDEGPGASFVVELPLASRDPGVRGSAQGKV